MKQGLLWFDNSNRDLLAKVGVAATRYRCKFNAEADTCYVHPSALKDGKATEVGGVRVVPLLSVLRHHFWIGKEEARNDIG